MSDRTPGTDAQGQLYKAYQVNPFDSVEPTEEQAQAMFTLRGYFRTMLARLEDYAPPSPQRTLAIRKLEEAAMWANKAITHGTP